MNGSTVWILLVSLAQYCTQVLAEEEEHFRFRHCGGLIYTRRDPCYIEYKIDTKLARSEFCVWVFQPTASKPHKLKIEYSSDPATLTSKDGVMVYTWTKDGFQEFELPKNKSSLTLYSTLVLVALSTYPNNDPDRGKGVRIAIYADLVFNNKNTEMHFMDKPEGEFSFPRGKSHYKYDAHFVLVLQTQKHRNPFDLPLKFKHIELTDVGTVGGQDIVGAYELYPYAYKSDSFYLGKTFKYLAGVSGKYEGPVPKTASLTPFPYVVLFTAEACKNVTGTGFTVRWSNPDWLE